LSSRPVPVLGLTFVKSQNVPGTTALPLARVHLGETHASRIALLHPALQRPLSLRAS